MILRCSKGAKDKRTKYCSNVPNVPLRDFSRVLIAKEKKGGVGVGKAKPWVSRGRIEKTRTKAFGIIPL
jgi:hypothetical protein